MNVDEMDNDPRVIKTRLDLAVFVARLSQELREYPERWENATLDRFLEALSRYLTDLDGYSQNVAPDIDADRPEWRVFAIALAGAAVYE